LELDTQGAVSTQPLHRARAALGPHVEDGTLVVVRTVVVNHGDEDEGNDDDDDGEDNGDGGEDDGDGGDDEHEAKKTMILATKKMMSTTRIGATTIR
jgi:hypothetical protein